MLPVLGAQHDWSAMAGCRFGSTSENLYDYTFQTQNKSFCQSPFNQRKLLPKFTLLIICNR